MHTLIQVLYEKNILNTKHTERRRFSLLSSC